MLSWFTEDDFLMREITTLNDWMLDIRESETARVGGRADIAWIFELSKEVRTQALKNIISGKIKIAPKEREPAIGEKYWCLDIYKSSQPISAEWRGSHKDYMFWGIGNFGRTKMEAMEAIEKIKREFP